MEYVALGRTDLRVSRICFGCATLGGYDYGAVADETSIAAVRRAVDLGINFFDVADVYGLGRAESVLRCALGPRLRDIVTATKFGVAWTGDGRTSRDISPTYLRRALEASLRRLGLDTVPLYQIHCPDGTTTWDDCMAELEACRAEGKVQHIGVCNLSLVDVEACQRAGRLESLQLPFSLAEPEQAQVMTAARRDWQMSTLSYNVLAHGLFSGKYTRDAVFSGTDLRTRVPLLQEPQRGRVFALLERIRRVAEMSGRSCLQVAVAWTLAHPSVSVAIVGTRTSAQIEESAGATGWQWLDDYRTILDAADTDAHSPPS